MKKLYIALLVVVVVLLLAVGVFSVAYHTDAATSERQEITPMPEFSWESVKDGSYFTQLEDHYADTFPFREWLLSVSRVMNQFYAFSVGDKNELIIDYTGGAEQGGAKPAIDPVQGDETPEVTPTEKDPPVASETEQTPPEVPQEPQEPEKPKPEIDVPADNEVTHAGAIVISGDRAMEIPTMVNSAIKRYGATVSALAEGFGPDVRTFSIITPNSGQFYSPISLHTGSHDQRALIDMAYENMSENVHKVDAFSVIERHVDEYLYFRTDHHWTQRGAYYAYTAFCKSAGFTAPALDDYETGTHEGFVGSLYNWTANYPQSKALKDNPDTVHYYLPRYECHAKYYMNSSLTNGIPISVIDKNLRSSVSNKYMCFLCGDTPICVIESAAEGGTCLVVKESYGNAFVPCLTEHYSKVIAVDAREFNKSGKPYLNLVNFVQEQGVNDVIILNYPFMVCTSSYITMLENLMK